MVIEMTVPENLPQWLRKWNGRGAFPVREFFASRVVFYPGSGTDGQPVKFFGSRHAAHCFVLVDYGIPKTLVENELGEAGHPFMGYARVGRSELRESDLTPNAWVRHLQPEQAQPFQQAPEKPYAFVEVLDRLPGFGQDHGPKRLAILFLCADGVAAYDALFCQDGAKAPYAAVLQDHGYGGNWTRFGRGGQLEILSSQIERWPAFLLVAANTEVWSGYSAVDGAIEGGGGMHGFVRQLWQRAPEGGAAD